MPPILFFNTSIKPPLLLFLSNQCLHWINEVAKISSFLYLLGAAVHRPVESSKTAFIPFHPSIHVFHTGYKECSSEDICQRNLQLTTGRVPVHHSLPHPLHHVFPQARDGGVPSSSCGRRGVRHCHPAGSAVPCHLHQVRKCHKVCSLQGELH